MASLKAWKQESGLSYNEVARRANVSKSTVANIVNSGIKRNRYSRRALGKVIATVVWQARRMNMAASDSGNVPCPHCGQPILVKAQSLTQVQLEKVE